MVRAEAAEGALPEAILAWRGRAVRLHDSRAPLCSGVVIGFAVVGRLWPYDWDGSLEDGELPRPVTGEIWQLAAPVLAAEVRPTAGRCASASWARADDEPAPRFALSRPAFPRLAETALAAFRRLASYAEIEQRYLSPEPGNPVVRTEPWESFDGAEPAIVLCEDPASRAALVVVAAVAGSGCGEFSGQLTAVFRLDGKDEPRLEWLGDLAEHVVPDGAADLDGDGVFELLFPSGVLHLERGQVTQDALAVPFYGCPC